MASPFKENPYRKFDTIAEMGPFVNMVESHMVGSQRAGFNQLESMGMQHASLHGRLIAESFVQAGK